MHENLYSATYSGVPVYEFIHPKSSVMRRKKDGWVNATHILKVANFPKAKRTRILEKDVQTGIHEKVQGGYGKYQGTWVPLKRAIEIAQQFGVLNDLNPVFDYVSNGSITPPPAPKHHHATTATGTRKPRTTKTKANKNDNKNDNINNVTSSDTPTRKNKRQKTDPVDNKKKLTTLSIPANSNASISTNLTPTSASRKSLNNNNASADLYYDNSTYNKRVLKAPNSNSNSNSNFNSNSNSNSSSSSNSNSNLNVKNPLLTNNLRILDDDLDDDIDDEDDQHDNHNIIQQSINNDDRNTNSFYHRLHQEPSTVEFMTEQDLDKALAESETYGGDLRKNSSLYYNNSSKNFTLNPIVSPRLPLSAVSSSLPFFPPPSDSIHNSNVPSSNLDKSYVKALYSYFIEMDSNPQCEMPHFITHEYSDFNVNQPLDNQGNTALHWACSMGDLKMCEILIKRNADVHALNNKGEESIVRSVIYANCYTRRTFNKLLDLLSDCLLDIDYNGRTLLHHIALATSDKKNLPSSRYYTEILLIKIAETVQSNDLFKEFIDKQDNDGNTALHIMSFNNAQKCIKILLGYNARVDIRNKLNDQVGDYLTENFKNDLNHPGIINSRTEILPNNNVESFNLRPFKPSFNGNFTISNKSGVNNKSTNSYMEPFYSQNGQLLHAYNHNPNLLNFSQSSYVNNIYNTNHPSTTSLKMNQINSEVFDKLNELSSAFDNEISQKDDDIRELSSIVDQMDNDIEKTSHDIKSLLKNIFGLKIKNIHDSNDDLDHPISQVELQLADLSNSYNEKCTLLKGLIDRSQAMSLAKIVQQFEHESLSEINESAKVKESRLDSTLSNDVLIKLINLAKLQIIRKKSVELLVNIFSKSGSNIEVINSYRRLVSRLSNMPINDVDNSLNSIEECLRKDLDSNELNDSNLSPKSSTNNNV